MFSLFNKKQPVDKNNILASITYLIKENHDLPIINIEIKDYESISIEALTKLLSVLGEDRTFIDTVNMVKTSFVDSNKSEEFLDIFNKIFIKINNKVINSHIKNMQDEPCIKPSEMMK